MAYEMILTALADPTRRAIFEDLRGGGRTVAALAEGRSVSRPAVSQHLKVLDLAGLVEVRQEGRSRIYSLRRGGLAPLRTWIDRMWDDALTAYAEEVARQTEDMANAKPGDQVD
ncbi:MAG: metalloregulator ArsR/SmtB family transcription factor [Pseudomonadota bacterium]